MLDFYSLSKEKIIPFILDYFTSHNGIRIKKDLTGFDTKLNLTKPVKSI